MAKRIVDEEMRFSVIINGNEAQKELFELEKSTRDLTRTNKELRAERTRLKNQGKQETAEYKKLDAQIKENTATLKSNKARMSELRSEVGLAGLSMRQLKQEASRLKLQLYNMIPGSAEYKKLQADLKAVDARMKELRTNAQATRSSIGRLADGFNRYAALGASVIATGTGMVLSIQKVIDYNSKLSDSQADVMKTTGLTKEEVDELTKSLGMFKTRTARAELLGLAEEAGRLGITGVKNLQDYLGVANQVKVALGDDLSDEAIREVGKIVNIYKVGEQTGRDFAGANLALGSSINEVSASGANQAGFLVEYLKRQAGVAAQTKVSADQNIGYAATFDEIGQSVEVSATAMNKVWIDMFDNTAAYAKIAGMSITDFKKLLETDANAAMIKFLKGLNGNNEGMDIMVERLADLEVGGARGTQALLALANNTELLEKRQKTASESMKEATSLTEEYNTKNNNFAATIDKIQKKLVGLFSSETIVNKLEQWAIWFAKFIGAAEDASGEVSIWRERLLAAFKVILVLTASILSYKAAIQLASLWTARSSAITKIHYGLLVAQEIATKSLALAKALLTGNIQKVTVAYRALTATMALNPIGAILAVVGAAVAAYYAFAESAEEAATKQDLLNDATADAQRNIQAEKSEVEGLIAIAKDDTIQKSERLKAIQKLNDISPEYLGNLSLENINTQETKKSLDEYVGSLERAAKAKALKAMYDAKVEELVKKENSSLEESISFWEELTNGFLALGDVHEMTIRNAKTATENRMKEVAATKEEIKVLEELYKAQLKTNANADGSSEPTGPKEGDTKLIGEDIFVYKGGKWVKKVFGGGGSGDPKESEYKVNASKEAAELRRIQEENDRLKASLIEDSFQKEIAQEEANHQAKLQKLREQKIEEAELLKLDSEINKATANGDTKRADELSETKEIWLKRNAEINRQMELEESIHQNKIGSLIQKGLQEQFQKEQDQYEREKLQREIKHNEELAALGNDERAKKALQEKFNKEEQQREINHLEDLTAEMKRIINQADFEGFDLDLLSEEEKQALLDFLDEANLKLSNLINNASGTENLSGSRIDGNVDILGFTIDQWDQTFKNLETAEQKIAAAEMAIGGMMNAWGMYSNFVAQKQQVELQQFERAQDQKKQSLERQLDRGLINQRQYNQAVEALERETRKKQAEMQYKQAKREKQMMMANIIMNTAAGVAKALAQGGFVLGVPWAAIVGALGAVQLGLAAATPLPSKGYEEGYYPVKREQDGKVFNATYGGAAKSGLVDKPTHFLAGEGGKDFPEMIIDGNSWKKMDPGVKDSLQREISRVRGYAAGYYKNDTSGSAASKEVTGSDEAYLMLAAALNRNSSLMEKLEKTGLPAFLKRDTELARNIKEDIDEYTKLRNANKLG